jgi:hypothetical protein
MRRTSAGAVGERIAAAVSGACRANHVVIRRHESSTGTVTRRTLHSRVGALQFSEQPEIGHGPSFAALCEHYEVSNTVIRAAMLLLKAEGLIDGRQGKGVYIANPLPR